MRRIQASLLILLLHPIALLAQPGRPAQLGSLAFTHVTVIDATGSPAKPNMTVVITGNRITALGGPGAVRIPQGTEVVNGRLLRRAALDKMLGDVETAAK